MTIAEDEFAVPFFKENGFQRKRCESCGSFFWTQRPDERFCGDSPCVRYSFIGRSPAKRSFTVSEMRNLFLSFFERHGHTRIKPYPVVARWRDDVFLVGASIYDFQPYVTEGSIPPPANPLVISQPSIRFTDIDNVGATLGRHDLIFEMGGAHAFNYPDKQVYWMNDTIKYHHQLATEELGLSSESITYKEHFWSGGGNAGPDLECLCAGLEISTLVFMQYKTRDGDLEKLNIRTVDTGYGIERWAWLSQGNPSAFQVTYGTILDRILTLAKTEFDRDILARAVPYSSYMSVDENPNRVEARKKMAAQLGMDWIELEKALTPYERAATVADHTKAIAFLLAEGIVPSNVEEGYLSRLLIRRTYRLLQQLMIEDRMLEILDLQIDYWGQDFPQLKEMKNAIAETIKVEEEKYRRTLSQGTELVKRMSGELKKKGLKEIPLNSLIELYDSHGIAPETVKGIAEPLGLKVETPGNFFAQVAKKHTSPEASKRRERSDLPSYLKDKLNGEPATIPLYYKDSFRKNFEARVTHLVDGEFVVLDQTCFYPEGGGQPGDTGRLETSRGTVKVVDTQKVGDIVVHRVEGTPPSRGEMVRGVIDWDRRLSLMRHHTGTHLILGAARRVLGRHAWQAGAQKGVESSRIDISHYSRITDQQTRSIERLATEAALEDTVVDIEWLPREKAEQKYGYIIYQGGIVPGRDLRIVKIGEWDVEACAGTHCSRTGQIGSIKILRTERVQDGVERIIFAAGLHTLRFAAEQEAKLNRIATLIGTSRDRVDEQLEAVLKENAELSKRLQELSEQWILHEESRLLATPLHVGEVKVCRAIYESGSEEEIVKLIEAFRKRHFETVTILLLVRETVRIFVGAGEAAIRVGIHAGRLAEELAKIARGRGGGKDYFGQGGGPHVDSAARIIEEAPSLIKSMMKRG